MTLLLVISCNFRLSQPAAWRFRDLVSDKVWSWGTGRAAVIATLKWQTHRHGPGEVLFLPAWKSDMKFGTDQNRTRTSGGKVKQNYFGQLIRLI